MSSRFSVTSAASDLNLLSIAEWTIIGIPLVPSRNVSVNAYAQAMLIDVRNGAILVQDVMRELESNLLIGPPSLVKGNGSHRRFEVDTVDGISNVIKELPKSESVPFPVEVNLVIEYYSKRL